MIQKTNTLRHLLIKQIYNLSASGKNLTLIGPAGSGVSEIFSYLQNHPSPQTKFIYFDLLLCLSQPISQLIGSLQQLLDSNPKHTTLILDNFDHISTPTYSSFHHWLAGWYFSHRWLLNLVFQTNNLSLVNGKVPEVGTLKPLLVSNLLKLLPLDLADAGQLAAAYNLNPSEETLKKLFSQSGGHVQTLKRLLELQSDPEKTRLQLSQNLNTLYRNLSPFLKENDLLTEFGLIDKGRKFRNIEFEEFLSKSSASTKDFTKNEQKLFDFLRQNINQTITKENLILHLYGNQASVEISNHALDQLIYRLRSKLKNTHRGLVLKTKSGQGLVLYPL